LKLSDAISLGMTLSPVREATWTGCALGLAANACGVPKSVCRWELIRQTWPWIESLHFYYETQIIRQFDTQVIAGTMTMEELIAYVRSVEPQCDCNTFGCCCARIEHLVPEESHVDAEDGALATSSRP
jgi:hypothetical protein